MRRQDLDDSKVYHQVQGYFFDFVTKQFPSILSSIAIANTEERFDTKKWERHAKANAKNTQILFLNKLDKDLTPTELIKKPYLNKIHIRMLEIAESNSHVTKAELLEDSLVLQLRGDMNRELDEAGLKSIKTLPEEICFDWQTGTPLYDPHNKKSRVKRRQESATS